MTRYMLDTNTVSQALRGHPQVLRRLTETPMESLCVSAITEAELAFGLAKRPAARGLAEAVGEFLSRVDILPWDSAVAETYGRLRAGLETRGKTLAALDMLIAAHAASASAVLVTNDAAFAQVEQLEIEDWQRV